MRKKLLVEIPADIEKGLEDFFRDERKMRKETGDNLISPLHHSLTPSLQK
jgi:hypothetical protein